MISRSLQYGPQKKETMELVNYWLIEKQLVHKFFYVILPRFQNYTTYTRLYRCPKVYPEKIFERAVLELKGFNSNIIILCFEYYF